MIGISAVEGAGSRGEGHGLTRTDTEILGVEIVENGVVFWVCWGRMAGRGFWCFLVDFRCE